MTGLKTIEDAFDFVQEVGICTIFSGKARDVQSLWDAVDLPDNDGRTKWGQRVEAVWAWKTELPTFYPDDIFYGKIKGGHAALMSMDYFRDTHFPKHARPVASCKELAQQVYEIIRLSPGTTAEVRREAMDRFGCTKSRFDSALKELQISLNVVRLNEPGLKNDTWVRFAEVYGELGLEAPEW